MSLGNFSILMLQCLSIGFYKNFLYAKISLHKTTIIRSMHKIEKYLKEWLKKIKKNIITSKLIFNPWPNVAKDVTYACAAER